MDTITVDKKPRKRRPGCVRLIISSCILLTLGVIWALFMAGDFRAFEVIGDSMIPTLEKGDRVIAKKADAALLQRGDVVVVDLPSEDHDELIKRLVALPGDTIALRDGVFYVNDEPEPLPEGAPPSSPTAMLPRIRLGPDAYFVLGDNRPISYDSEEFGPVPAKEIWGVVLFRYIPWSKRGKV